MGYSMQVVDEDGRPVPGVERWDCAMAGGCRLADLLIGAGMAYWPHGEAKMPDMPMFYDDDQDPLTGDSVVPEHRAVEWSYLRATWDERPGIAAHKLCRTNDGWWVTRAECESALKLWERAGEPPVVDRLGDVLPFLRAAAEYEGFRVW